MQTHKIVSRDEWIAARRELLAKEKALLKAKDTVRRETRELPWVKIDKNYVFDGPNGKETLADLFAGRSQLIVKHFMLAPGWKEGCLGCSFGADQVDGSVVHLVNHDVMFVAISRAPYPEIADYHKRMGWKFKWVSSSNNDFNFDFHVSFRPEDKSGGKVEYNYEITEFPSEEAPGLSAFIKQDGAVFHTYSTYGRGLDILLGAYNFLDMAPKGRDEDALPWSMAWVRRHDEYENKPKAGNCCA